MWPFRRDDDFTPGNALFDFTVKLVQNADKDKYKYSEYGIGVDKHGTFSLSHGRGFGKNVIIIGASMSSSVHVGNRKKNILILGNPWNSRLILQSIAKIFL